MTSFSTLGLRAELLRAVSEQGYETPTPVQAQAIPPVMEGRDVLAAAQTGTGKTAGFTLPILQRLAANPLPNRRIRVLILVPTRELAAQVEECVTTYGRYLPFRSTVIFGGVGFQPQVDALRRGVDIVVATPGRLLDHTGQRTIDLSAVEMLVLDEADRMLDMGFIRDIRRVLALLPAKRQNLLFSATFSDDIRGLADGLLSDPVRIEVARRNATAENVTQTVVLVDRDRKRELLAELIGKGNWRQVLVFTRTKHGANRLAEQLERDGLTTAPIHGNKSQGARTRALAEFKSGKVRVLVATDIAARGLDIDELPHVVNYELPSVPEDYVHRIGRTGRAGSDGEALSLVGQDELAELRAIERLLKRDLPKRTEPGYEPGFNARSPSLTRPKPERPPRSAQRSGPPRARNEAAGNARGATGGRDAAPGNRPAAGHRGASSHTPRRPDAPRGTDRGGDRPRAATPPAVRRDSHGDIDGNRPGASFGPPARSDRTGRTIASARPRGRGRI